MVFRHSLRQTGFSYVEVLIAALLITSAVSVCMRLNSATNETAKMYLRAIDGQMYLKNAADHYGFVCETRLSELDRCDSFTVVAQNMSQPPYTLSWGKTVTPDPAALIRLFVEITWLTSGDKTMALDQQYVALPPLLNAESRLLLTLNSVKPESE